MGTRKNVKLALGKRVWAWPFPLPSSWQLEGLGDGLGFATFDGRMDYEWPPEEYCSDSSCSRSSLDDEPLTLHSDASLKVRPRRDSEGYLLPPQLPWHSDPNLIYK
jgi:hypothetical protein